MNMLTELCDFLEENELSQNIVKQSIISHLHDLSQWFDEYFPEDTTPLDIITLHNIKSPPSISDLIEALDDLQGCWIYFLPRGQI